ncbi:MAG: HNH endonuclease [Polaromonas sp.]|nr:HNH endonuclease [Polaromonas sp.]
MSYEGKMLDVLEMPARDEVEQALLKALFRHDGVIVEFGAGAQIVEEIAEEFGLNQTQRAAALETIYRKENRIKKSLLWHRLLFRAAASLAEKGLISRPSATQKITGKREWMLTESGFDQSLRLLEIPLKQKNLLPTKSFEVQKLAKQITEASRPKIYSPFDDSKANTKTLRESTIRARGFRQAVLQAYDCGCAFCGMKISTPHTSIWEAEAAHIVPHSSMGRDDIWNGLSLCHIHHWAFDVGWLSLQDDFTIQVSPKIRSLPPLFGKMQGSDCIRSYSAGNVRMKLPSNKNLHPHQAALLWHREHVFFNQV